MAHQRIMQRLAKWHVWLGWLVGVPMVMWTLSGLIMALRPIEEVRGEALLRDPAPVQATTLVLPVDKLGTVSAIALAAQVDGPAWIVTEADGGRYRYSARDGSLIPPVIESEARRIADDAWTGEAALDSVTYFPADLSPADLRAPFNAWQAHYVDGTNLYIRADTGEIVATRTGWWRTYDLMWGLHIMDLKTREDTSHPILILFAVLSLGGALLGCVLMFRRRKAKSRA